MKNKKPVKRPAKKMVLEKSQTKIESPLYPAASLTPGAPADAEFLSFIDELAATKRARQIAAEMLKEHDRANSNSFWSGAFIGFFGAVILSAVGSSLIKKE